MPSSLILIGLEEGIVGGHDGDGNLVCLFQQSLARREEEEASFPANIPSLETMRVSRFPSPANLSHHAVRICNWMEFLVCSALPPKRAGLLPSFNSRFLQERYFCHHNTTFSLSFFLQCNTFYETGINYEQVSWLTLLHFFILLCIIVYKTVYKKKCSTSYVEKCKVSSPILVLLRKKNRKKTAANLKWKIFTFEGTMTTYVLFVLF